MSTALIAMAERVVRGRVEPLPVLVAFDRRGQRMLTVLELARPGSQDPGMEARKAWIPVAVQAITPELAEKLGVPGKTWRPGDACARAVRHSGRHRSRRPDHRRSTATRSRRRSPPTRTCSTR